MSGNDGVIEEFRANSGEVGGFFKDKDLLLLHTTGARSGEPRVHPLVYVSDGERYLVAASKGGADTHPDWFFNVRANPAVSVEVGAGTLEVRAVFPEGAERDALYARLGERYPFFFDYQAGTERIIPVVALEPVA